MCNTYYVFTIFYHIILMIVENSTLWPTDGRTDGQTERQSLIHRNLWMHQKKKLLSFCPIHLRFCSFWRVGFFCARCVSRFTFVSRVSRVVRCRTTDIGSSSGLHHLRVVFSFSSTLAPAAVEESLAMLLEFATENETDEQIGAGVEELAEIVEEDEKTHSGPIPELVGSLL